MFELKYALLATLQLSSPNFPVFRRYADCCLVDMTSPPDGVDERAFAFLCNVIRFVRTIQPEPGIRRLIDQLVGAAGSIAANRQEALSASSRREFVRFNEISLRSAKESAVVKTKKPIAR